MSAPQQSSVPHPVEVAIDLHIASELMQAAVRATSAQQLESSLAEALQALLRRLGIPGAVALTVREGYGQALVDGPVIVRVNGSRVRYPAELCALLSQCFGLKPAEVPKDADLAVEYLTLLALEVLKTAPALLFGPAQLESYRSLLRGAVDAQAAESPHLERALKLALDLSISIANTSAVGDAISAAGDSSAIAVQEAIIRALRQPDIEIRLPLAHLRNITDENGDEWAQQFKNLRDNLVQESGIPLPHFRFVLDEELDPLKEEYPHTFCFQFNSLTTPSIRGLKSGEILVDAPVERIPEHMPASAVTNVATGRSAAIVPAKHREELQKSSLTTWDAGEFLILCLNDSMRRRCDLFIDESVVLQLMDNLRQEAPTLVELLYSLYSLADISAIFRALAAGRVPLWNLKKICGLLVEADRETTFNDRVAYVRAGMSWEITNALARSMSALPVYLLDVSVLDLLELASTTGLDESGENAIIEGVRTELDALPGLPPPAIIATPKTRASLQALLGRPFPRVHVTTQEEIVRDTSVQPIARISTGSRA